jgi:hypothetical protein
MVVLVNPYLGIFWNYFQVPNATSKPTTNAKAQTTAAFNSSELIIIFLSFNCLPLYILSAFLSTPIQSKSQNNQSFL